ncbi:MAG: hypothetical protein QGG74_00105 [Phycisphaerales bacterium]|nr:hypothetical protein [Phycisphaerales bacterium]
MPGVRIAMWSGPRNISTAMMRAWESRADVRVWDEPLYPLWLHRTGADHPGRDHVLQEQAGDLEEPLLLQRLAGGTSDASILYMKHMTHHLLPGLSDDWLRDTRHAFLIRDPQRVLASLAQKVPAAGIEDTGLPQQVALFRTLGQRGHPPPPVIDSDDVLAAPDVVLEALCARLAVPFDPAMLRWSPGSRPSDGSWGDWWYEQVRKSTGFAPSREIDSTLPSQQRAILPACMELYEELAALRITP